MKKLLFTVSLLVLLSACRVVVTPTDVSLGVSGSYSPVISRFEPDRGVGASYRVGEEVRFIITLQRSGYLSLVAIDPDGRSYEFEHGVYLAAGTYVLPLAQMRHRYVVDYPTGRQIVKAVFTDTRPSGVRFQGVYSNDGFKERLRLYFNQSYASVRDVAQTYFYISTY